MAQFMNLLNSRRTRYPRMPVAAYFLIACTALAAAAGAQSVRPRPDLRASWTTLVAHKFGSAEPHGPEIIASGPKTRPVAMPDGEFRAFRVSSGKVVSVSSADSGRTWSRPRPEFDVPHQRMGGGIGLIDAEGEIHLILTHVRGDGRPADTRFIDLWHVRTINQREQWNEPRRIWEGYCGAVMDFKQLRDGRIIVPFAAWKRPGEVVVADTGSNYTTVVYSDDGGDSWQLSPEKLTSPCESGYNGNNYGAIEPTVLELADGRVWMLMRTQTGYLYESYSDDGANWTPAQPSRFHSSTSPAALARLPDGRIILFWNNCETPPRHEGAGVYGGRDALHAAISADEGKTWSGFREVYRDPYRNDSPPRSGDRGTAYPLVTVASHGDVVLVTGQGNRRTTILIDPNWLTDLDQSDDFSSGVDEWHVWKHFGPASRFWRDRTIGPELREHPTRDDDFVLQIRRPDGESADCASWNFAARDRGRLDLRIYPHRGAAGIDICLNNRFFNPGDQRGQTEAAFHLRIPADGRLSDEVTVEHDAWSTFSLAWDVAETKCDVEINGKRAARLAIRKCPFGGISYLRLVSAAGETDDAGYLIESVRVSSPP